MVHLGQVATAARRIGALTGQGRVGILLRNEPAHVAALLGVLAGGGTVVVINPSRGDDRARADLEALQLPVIIGLQADLAALAPTSHHDTRITVSIDFPSSHLNFRWPYHATVMNTFEQTSSRSVFMNG